MIVRETPIAGVRVLEPEPFEDARGRFARVFCVHELADVLGGRAIAQANQSLTRMRGAVRGMHYQLPPHAEMKFVRCTAGAVWDVALDLRAGSPTFLRWFGVELTPDNMKTLVVPEGCAHGFQVLEPDAQLVYLHTACYAPGSEGGVRHDDPRAGIQWPLAATDLSARDAAHPPLDEDFGGIVL